MTKKNQENSQVITSSCIHDAKKEKGYSIGSLHVTRNERTIEGPLMHNNRKFEASTLHRIATKGYQNEPKNKRQTKPTYCQLTPNIIHDPFSLPFTENILLVTKNICVEKNTFRNS